MGCVLGKSGDDCSDGDGMAADWVEQVDACENLTWGGHNDWTVPDNHQLEKLEQNEVESINSEAFPNLPGPQEHFAQYPYYLWSRNYYSADTGTTPPAYRALGQRVYTLTAGMAGIQGSIASEYYTLCIRNTDTASDEINHENNRCAQDNPCENASVCAAAAYNNGSWGLDDYFCACRDDYYGIHCESPCANGTSGYYCTE